MHNSYYFLRKVAAALDDRLKGFQLVSCFSQSRDELVMEFHKNAVHHFVRASLLPELAVVTFPRQIRRARKNSVDLFPALVMSTVEGAQVYENDRSFSLHLSGGHAVLFKMHGNRSNVLHLIKDRAVDVFRKGIEADLDLKPESLATAIDWTELPQDPRSHFLTFTREVWQSLSELGFKDRSPQEQWQMILNAKAKLETADTFYHVEYHRKLMFSLLPFGRTVETFDNPLEGVTAFAAAYLSSGAFDREKGNQSTRLHTLIRKTEGYLEKTRAHYQSLKADQHFQVWGDLLMANLDKVLPGEKSVTVANFYEGDVPVTIRLNPQMSPQKNAEVYYRKSKNRAIELKRNQEVLIAKEMELLNLNRHLVRVNAASTIQELRDLAPAAPALKDPEEPKLPYRESTFKGFRIWIGKDASANDELTSRFGYKEDLWLHAKDVAGSHVLIKHQAGKKFPKDVIERAAQLAAFYSKRKTDTLCPVAYTPKKYVRKRKGDPAGMVVVEKETVILVEPRGI